MELGSARELKQLLEQKALFTPAMVGLRGVGPMPAQALASVDAQPTVALGIAPGKNGQYALAVRVQQRALEGSRQVELIARQAKGEVDVRYIGRAVKRPAPWHQRRCRPLRIGCSVGHRDVTAGTLGCFVRPRGGGRERVLSNNHVLANENRCKKGDAILQAGAVDGGKDPADRVAALSDYVKLKRSGVNILDAATAELLKGIEAQWTKLTGLGRLKGVGDVFLDEGRKVAKVGRTTGMTRGHVTAFELDNVVVEYGIGLLRFDDQVEIEGEGDEAFSDGGDSGSLIVGADLRAVALLFAGSDLGGANGKGLTYANPIHPVLDTMRLELVL